MSVNFGNHYDTIARFLSWIPSKAYIGFTCPCILRYRRPALWSCTTFQLLDATAFACHKTLWWPKNSFFFVSLAFSCLLSPTHAVHDQACRSATLTVKWAYDFGNFIRFSFPWIVLLAKLFWALSTQWSYRMWREGFIARIFQHVNHGSLACFFCLFSHHLRPFLVAFLIHLNRSVSDHPLCIWWTTNKWSRPMKSLPWHKSSAFPIGPNRVETQAFLLWYLTPWEDSCSPHQILSLDWTWCLSQQKSAR